MMPTGVNKANVLAHMQAGKLWLMRNGQEVQLNYSAKHPVQKGVWEIPFHGWVGASMVCGSITPEWFDEAGNINRSYVRLKE